MKAGPAYRTDVLCHRTTIQPTRDPRLLVPKEVSIRDTPRVRVQRVSPRTPNAVQQSGGFPQEEGSHGCPGRSRDTRYGTRGPGSRADRNAKTWRHGSLAGDNSTSHRHRPSCWMAENRRPGQKSRNGNWPGPSPTNADEYLHACQVARSDHDKTRWGNRPTRNTLQRPRGARSAVAFRALSGAPTRPPVAPAWRPTAGQVRFPGVSYRAARFAPSSMSPRRRLAAGVATPHQVPRLRRRRRFQGNPGTQGSMAARIGV